MPVMRLPSIRTFWQSGVITSASTRRSLSRCCTSRIERLPDYGFIQGWTAGEDLSVLANSSDNTVRIPGIMPRTQCGGASFAQPGNGGRLAQSCCGLVRVSGRVVDAHLDCGNGVTWSIEVRRGHATQRLATGVTEGGTDIRFGPVEEVPIEVGQVVALVIGPRDGNHGCDLTSIDLSGERWQVDLGSGSRCIAEYSAGQSSRTMAFPEPTSGAGLTDRLAGPHGALVRAPAPERASEVREHLRKDFPLTHPLLTSALRSFRASRTHEPLSVQAPSVLELNIPAELSEGAELVVTGKLASGSEGSVQLQVSTAEPGESLDTLIPNAPVIVDDDSPARQGIQRSFDQFRSLFPIALCYSRIVPVDEVVTLRLFYREDQHLQRLMLDDAEIGELNRLWDELLFVSQAPLKQVDAFEQTLSVCHAGSCGSCG